MSSTRHVRTRTGCWTCRFRKKKCDEKHPACEQCSHLRLVCDGYDAQPIWMKDPESAAQKKEEIKKQMVRRSRRRKKNQDLNKQQPQSQNSNQAPKLPTPPPTDEDVHHGSPFGQTQHFPAIALPTGHDEHDYSALFTTSSPEDSTSSEFPTFNMNQVAWSIDDIHNKSVLSSRQESPRNALTPPTTSSALPSTRSSTRESSQDQPFKVEEEEEEEMMQETEADGQQNSTGRTPNAMIPYRAHTTSIPFFETYDLPIQRDRKIDADLANLYLRTIFGVTYRALSDAQVDKYNQALILPMFLNNKSFLHGCLSSTALHLTATNVSETQRKGLMTEVFRHRHKSLHSLKRQIAQSKTAAEQSAIAATICALISFEVFSRKTEWQVHVRAATDCVKLLNWCNSPPEDPGEWFIYSRILWLDILSSISTGIRPVFAEFYHRMLFYPPEMRNRNRLVEMTGCDDTILYLISEITCLEQRKFEMLALNPSQSVVLELLRQGAIFDEQLKQVPIDIPLIHVPKAGRQFSRHSPAHISPPGSPMVSSFGSDFSDDDEIDDDFDGEDYTDDDDFDDMPSPEINEIAALGNIAQRTSGAVGSLPDYYQEPAVMPSNSVLSDTHAGDVFVAESNKELIEDRGTFKKAVTVAFQIMARVYLRIITKGFNPHDPEAQKLLLELMAVIDFIPSGYMGYERSIISPLLIVGSLALEKQHRDIISARLKRTTHMAKYGNLGNVDKILTEVWVGQDAGRWTLDIRQAVPWRQVMEEKNWKYLMV